VAAVLADDSRRSMLLGAGVSASESVNRPGFTVAGARQPVWWPCRRCARSTGPLVDHQNSSNLVLWWHQQPHRRHWSRPRPRVVWCDYHELTPTCARLAPSRRDWAGALTPSQRQLVIARLLSHAGHFADAGACYKSAALDGRTSGDVCTEASALAGTV